MRVGIVGVGRIGEGHAAVLAAHPEVSELVVTDADADRARATAFALGGTFAADAEAMLARDLGAIVISTPTPTHAPLIEAAVAAGVPTFCEKPVALGAARTRAVLERVGGSGVAVQIGFQRRFDPGYVAAREAVRDGTIGELRRVHVVSADPAPPAATFFATSGGIFRDLSIHDLDVLRYVTGREVERVLAVGVSRGDHFIRDAGDVDESAALLVLDDGTLATLQGSRYNGAGYDIRMEVAGTAATWVVGLTERSPFRSAEPGSRFPEGQPWATFRARFVVAYEAEIHAFIDVALGRRESECTVADALEASYVADALDRSLHTRCWVDVAEVKGS